MKPVSIEGGRGNKIARGERERQKEMKKTHKGEQQKKRVCIVSQIKITEDM